MPQLEENKQVVRRFFKAIEDGDLAAADALLHPDARWWVLGFGELNKAGLMPALQGLTAAHKRFMQIDWMIAEGDYVAAQVRGELAYPDKTYANQYHSSFRIKDGLLIEGREYMDTRAAEAFMAG